MMTKAKQKTVAAVPMIELEDTEGMRTTLNDTANRAVYDRVSSLFYIAVFGRLVDYGEAPTDAHVEEAVGLAIAPDDFCRLREDLSNVNANPGPVHTDYGLDTRQILSENQYQAVIENSARFMTAVTVERALSKAGFEPTTTKAEVMVSVLEAFTRRQKFRQSQEAFGKAQNNAMMGKAKDAFKETLAGLK